MSCHVALLLGMMYMSPAGQPSSFDEKRKHFLWRFWKEVPGLGGMALFDRSWYGRVLVERVEGYATKEQWKRAYEEIVQFERQLVLEGVIIVKFWLQISADEQLRRFQSRQKDSVRRWKLTDEDWRNRDRRAEYVEAVEDMVARTDQPYAPWHLIPADSKRYARVAVISWAMPNDNASRRTSVNPASRTMSSSAFVSGRYATDFGKYRYAAPSDSSAPIHGTTCPKYTEWPQRRTGLVGVATSSSARA